MNRDTGDILDRWSIAKLKSERIGSPDSIDEYVAFEGERQSIKHLGNVNDWSKIMYDINDFIWQLEAGLKSGKESLPNPHYLLDAANQEVLSRIGLTSMLIRNFNHIRVAYKNLINKTVGEGYQDSKKDHLSC